MSHRLGTDYAQALSRYLGTSDEAALLSASELGKRCQDGGLGPEELVGFHMDALEAQPAPLDAKGQISALAVLLEMMTS